MHLNASSKRFCIVFLLFAHIGTVGSQAASRLGVVGESLVAYSNYIKRYNSVIMWPMQTLWLGSDAYNCGNSNLAISWQPLREDWLEWPIHWNRVMWPVIQTPLSGTRQTAGTSIWLGWLSPGTLSGKIELIKSQEVPNRGDSGLLLSLRNSNMMVEDLVHLLNVGKTMSQIKNMQCSVLCSSGV